jgi:DNA-nicking Smr family endonuclease
MHRNYKLSHKLIAYTLLLSLFLQSCGNSSNVLIPRIKGSTENTPGATKQIATNPLVGQEFTAEGGCLVTFHGQGRELQADVRVDETQKEPNYRNLPVAIEKGTDLASWVKLDLKVQKRRVHVNLPKKGQPGSVHIFKGRLPAGMGKQGHRRGAHRGQEGNNQNKAKGNRKEKIGNVSTVSSSYTNVSTSSNRKGIDANSDKEGSLTVSPSEDKKRSKGKKKLKDDEDEDKYSPYEAETVKQSITRQSVLFIRQNVGAQAADDKILSQDFHGFKVPEFKAGVRKLLKQAQEESVNRVTLITGKGNHSPNGAVLLHVLPNLLKKEFSEVAHEVKRDLGAYEIVLKKKESLSLYEERLKKISSFVYNSKLRTKLVEDAKRGLSDAQHQLGIMLLEGIVFEKNRAAANRLK